MHRLRKHHRVRGSGYTSFSILFAACFSAAFLGVAALSVAIVMGFVFGRLSGFVGFLAGPLGTIDILAFSPLTGSYLPAVVGEAFELLPFALLAIWGLSAVPRLFKLQ